jgi:hypothetical protein
VDRTSTAAVELDFLAEHRNVVLVTPQGLHHDYRRAA